MARSDDLRKRLEALNRQPLGRLPTPAPRAEPKPEPPAEKPPPPPVQADTTPCRLEKIPHGRAVPASEGTFYLIERGLDDLWSDCDAFVARYGRIMTRHRETPPPEDRPEELQRLVQSYPDWTAYLDIETCGFSGTPAFLVGLLTTAGGRFVLRQYLARDYSEELAMLAAVWHELGQYDVVVSFNGKTFDLPFLRDRAARFRLPARPEPAHADLLHHCRRRYRHTLPNCKLQTLETTICRRYRRGDIPGDQIPDAYHAFVKTGDARQMKAILHHNALDLVTMAELVAELFEPTQEL